MTNISTIASLDQCLFLKYPNGMNGVLRYCIEMFNEPVQYSIGLSQKKKKEPGLPRLFIVLNFSLTSYVNIMVATVSALASLYMLNRQ